MTADQTISSAVLFWSHVSCQFSGKVLGKRPKLMIAKYFHHFSNFTPVKVPLYGLSIIALTLLSDEQYKRTSLFNYYGAWTY